MQGSTVFALTTSGAFASLGMMTRKALQALRSWTITEDAMAQTSFHPGEHLQEELDELSVPPSTFADQLGVPLQTLTDLLEGCQSVTAELALRLGHYFGTSAQFWLNLQSSFDLEQAMLLYGAEIEALPTLQAA